MIQSRLHGFVLAALFAALMMIGANITSIAPIFVIGGVPITLQTAVCLLSGLLLGKKYAPLAMVLYLLIGLAGMPVFARWSGGLDAIISPTFGFLLSYVLVAYVVGVLSEQKRSLAAFSAAALIGTALNYLVGTNWMYMAYEWWFAAPGGFSYTTVWLWMLAPMPKDILLAVGTAWLARRLLRILRKTERGTNSSKGAA